MKIFKPEFVDFIPSLIEEGVIYISIKYKTAIHNCACGCGKKVVTRFSPNDWKLIFDGSGISLHPSIGNWSFPCRSHYWLRNNQAINIPDRSFEENKSDSDQKIKFKKHTLPKWFTKKR